MKFDVLHDPWIPVVKADNEKKMLGIHEALRDAHLYKAVSCSNPLETCAVMRFLIAFLMDAYNPETLSDRRKLFRQGRFSEEVLLRYEELCRQEGVSFDLFDEKRPFMQAPYVKELDDGKEKSIMLLFHALPRGNTPLHFEHTKGNSFSATPAEALTGLLSLQLFSVAVGSQGYPSSVNNTSPYYVFVQGETLFQTFVVNMISKGECGNITWGEKQIAWRDTSLLVPKEEFTNISLLAGLTWQPRRITLIAGENGRIKNVFLQQGRNFIESDLWRDPNVTYIISKTGLTVSVKPVLSRMPWQDIGAYALSKNDAETLPAMVVRNADAIFQDGRPVCLLIAGLLTDKADYLGWVWDSINIPGSILFDWEKADRLRLDIVLTEKVADSVCKTVNKIIRAEMENNKKIKGTNSKKNKKGDSSLAKEAKTNFFERLHLFIFKEYIPTLDKIVCEEPGWDSYISGLLKEKIKEEALRIVCAEANRVGSDARSIEAQVQAMASFKKVLFKLCEQV